MDSSSIERYVSDLLTVSGFRSDGEEQHLWLLLHHLYCAVAMYEQMGDEDKVIIAETQKKLKYFFCTKCNLKERKRTKKEKESFPPTPLSKEKENKKEKDEKTTDTAERENSGLDDDQLDFWNQCKKYIGKKYSEEMVQSFFYYWAEKDEKTGKMLWQIQKEKKTWDIKFRLAGWSKRSYTRNDEIAAIRYRKTKKKEAKETAAIEQQQNIAAIREQADALREEQQAESKETQMLTADYLAQNPNGFLAKVAREREQREKKSTLKTI